MLPHRCDRVVVQAAAPHSLAACCALSWRPSAAGVQERPPCDTLTDGVTKSQPGFLAWRFRCLVLPDAPTFAKVNTPFARRSRRLGDARRRSPSPHGKMSAAANLPPDVVAAVDKSAPLAATPCCPACPPHHPMHTRVCVLAYTCARARSTCVCACSGGVQGAQRCCLRDADQGTAAR